METIPLTGNSKLNLALLCFWILSHVLDHPLPVWPCIFISPQEPRHKFYPTCVYCLFLFRLTVSYSILAGATACAPTLITVLSNFRSSMLLWLGRGFPVAEQKILGLELRFHSKLVSRSKILGARSGRGKMHGTDSEERQGREKYSHWAEKI